MFTSNWRQTRALAALGAGLAIVASTALRPAEAGRRCRRAGIACGVMPACAAPGNAECAAGAGGAPAVAAQLFMPTPPPGTLGQTYLRPSEPVPAAKHPRAGMLDVRAAGASSVSVQWTNPYRLDDELSGFVDARDAALWHFESPQLIPGVAQIYRVDARYGPPEACTVQTRYVRLVMGRVVNVAF